MAETKIYKVTFKAELTQEDVRAMNKCFFDCMNEGMEIYNLFDFEMEEIPQDKEDLSLAELDKLYEYHEEYETEEQARETAGVDNYTDHRIVKGKKYWHYFYNME